MGTFLKNEFNTLVLNHINYFWVLIFIFSLLILIYLDVKVIYAEEIENVKISFKDTTINVSGDFILMIAKIFR